MYRFIVITECYLLCTAQSYCSSKNVYLVLTFAHIIPPLVTLKLFFYCLSLNFIPSCSLYPKVIIQCFRRCCPQLQGKGIVLQSNLTLHLVTRPEGPGRPAAGAVLSGVGNNIIPWLVASRGFGQVPLIADWNRGSLRVYILNCTVTKLTQNPKPNIKFQTSCKRARECSGSFIRDQLRDPLFFHLHIQSPEQKLTSRSAQICLLFYSNNLAGFRFKIKCSPLG